MANVLALYNRLSKIKLGKILFSKIICFNAPYFKTIKPQFIDLKPGYCEIKMQKRRAVENHLHTVHAIAMANMCELAAGLSVEVAIPQTMRWIPINMNINYVHKAKTDVRAIAKFDMPDWTSIEDLVVLISVLDDNNQEVVNAKILMRISPKSE